MNEIIVANMLGYIYHMTRRHDLLSHRGKRGCMETNELSLNARGGTELMLRGLEDRVDPGLLEQFQIIPSRVRELRGDKIRVLWNHDCAEDPEAQRALGNGGWRRFHRLVFVSHWQMNDFIARYSIPWDRCVVLRNAIVPIEPHTKPEGTIRLVYTSTPQRGLDVLASAYAALAENDPDVELHVFSSFKLYGWEEADRPYESLFESLRALPRVTLHGAVPNAELREQLKLAHVFAYPSTWLETSCLCLMEAMSAGLLCVHPNYGALPETAANMTTMYQWREDRSAHAAYFHAVLRESIRILREGGVVEHLATQKSYADYFYGWGSRAEQWTSFLTSLLDLPRGFEETSVFSYRTGT